MQLRCRECKWDSRDIPKQRLASNRIIPKRLHQWEPRDSLGIIPRCQVACGRPCSLGDIPGDTRKRPPRRQ